MGLRSRVLPEKSWEVCPQLCLGHPSILITVLLPSVRAWRGLRFNDQYAVKLEKKLVKKQAQAQAKADAAEAERSKNASKSNPFSVRCSPRALDF